MLHPTASSRPSGLSASDLTSPGIASGSPSGSPVAAFQNRRVLNIEPVIRVRPSGVTATARIEPRCRSGGVRNRPDATSTRRAELGTG